MGIVSSIFIVFFGFTQTSQAKAKFPDLRPIPPKSAFATDPERSKLWHLDFIGVPQAWQTTEGHPDVVIAVVDSGVDYRNPDIRPALWENPGEIADNGIDDDRNGFVDDVVGWNFNEGNNKPWDDNGHGSYIASLLVAQKDNGLGGVGVCPNCRLMPLRFLDSDGFGEDEDSNKALKYAIENGASVINLSYAGEGFDRDLDKLLKRALAKDILVVVSAGNDGESNDRSDIYPANHRFPNMLTVGASTHEDKWRKNSNYSPSLVHLAAPGQRLWGLWNDGKYYVGHGTSFSSPIVAGVAGLVRSANPKLTAAQVRNILVQTARSVAGFANKCSSSGVVDAAAAVSCAVNPSCYNNLADHGNY